VCFYVSFRPSKRCQEELADGENSAYQILFFWPNFGDLSAKPIFKNSGLDNSADFQKNQLVSSYFLDLHPTTSSLLKFQVPKEQTLMW
jgi:hypothetical protein